MSDPALRPPGRIRAMGQAWNIKVVPHLIDDNENWGDTAQRTRTISLDPDAEQPHILWHEVGHIAEHALDLDVDDEDIHRLAKAQCAILADNPDLVVWLVRNLYDDDPAQVEAIGKSLISGE